METEGQYYHHCPVLDTSGNQLVLWIARFTGSCVYGQESAMSWVFGYISLICWLGAQLPQIITNYQNGSVEGLSLGLVFNWFLGDFTNFVGCILTHQLPFQTLLAFYYICVDTVLGGQFYYYTRPARKRFHLHSHRHKLIHRNTHNSNHSGGLILHNHHGHHNLMTDDNKIDYVENTSHLSSSVTTTRPVDVPHPMSSSSLSSCQRNNHTSDNIPSSGATPISNSGSFLRPSSFVNLKTLLTSSFVASFSKARAAPIFTNTEGFSETAAASASATIATTTTTTSDSTSININNNIVNALTSGLVTSLALKSEIIGLVFAWTCTCCYLTSRLPQIYTNYTRKSTSGTSILLFLAALTGNVTYTLSILLSPDARGPAGIQFIKNELPFLVGSAGTVMFDVTIFIQWFIYRESESDIAQEEKYQPILDGKIPQGCLVNSDTTENEGGNNNNMSSHRHLSCDSHANSKTLKGKFCECGAKSKDAISTSPDSKSLMMMISAASTSADSMRTMVADGTTTATAVDPTISTTTTTNTNTNINLNTSSGGAGSSSLVDDMEDNETECTCHLRHQQQQQQHHGTDSTTTFISTVPVSEETPLSTSFQSQYSSL